MLRQIVVLILLCGFVSIAWAQAEFKLMASDGTNNDYFGFSVGISGDVAVVGACEDDDYGDAAGAAYVYHWNGTTWIQHSKLFPNDNNAGDKFGFAVAVSGNWALIGTTRAADYYDPGMAYLFHWNGLSWVQHQSLIPSDPLEPHNSFGTAVAISGGWALVGDDMEDFSNGEEISRLGVVYVYQLEDGNWQYRQKLVPSDPAHNMMFGGSVAISEDVAIIGTDYNGADTAYIFRRNGTTWIQEQKLTPPVGSPENFGRSVSICGDVAIVGACRQDIFYEFPPGAAYIYRWNGNVWTLEQHLDAGANAGSLDLFGQKVAIYENTALVSAAGEWVPNSYSYAGAVHHFQWDGAAWQRKAIMTGNVSNNARFGESIAIGENEAIVGAYQDDGVSAFTGSAHVFMNFAYQTGDIDQNNVLDANDVVLMLDAVLYPSYHMTGAQVMCYDVNGDGWITVQDIVSLVNAINNL